MPSLQPPAINFVNSFSDAEFLLDAGGESALTRVAGYNNGSATASQQLRLTGFLCKRTEVVNNIAFNSGATAAAATPTLVKFALYERNSDASAYNLVAVTANTIATFATVNTRYVLPTLASFIKQQGREYLVGNLVVTGAAPPTFQCGVAGTLPSNFTPMVQTPVRSAVLTGQADIPPSFLVSALVALGSVAICEVLP